MAVSADQEKPFATLDTWADSLPRFLTYGRQGLFAHDNTHHALAMAYAAERCFGANGFDETRWAAYREAFSPGDAVADVRVIANLSKEKPLAINFYRAADADKKSVNLKVWNCERPLPLSERATKMAITA